MAFFEYLEHSKDLTAIVMTYFLTKKSSTVTKVAVN